MGCCTIHESFKKARKFFKIYPVEFCSVTPYIQLNNSSFSSLLLVSRGNNLIQERMIFKYWLLCGWSSFVKTYAFSLLVTLNIKNKNNLNNINKIKSYHSLNAFSCAEHYA